MKRRHFIQNTAATAAGISILGSGMFGCTKTEANEIGMALYSMAKVLSDDFPGTLKMLSELGYKNVEFAGPYYFSTQEEIDNNILVQRMGLKGYGYYGNTPKELRALLDDLGLVSSSAHISDATMNNNMEEVLNAAQIVGHKYLISPMFRGQSLDDYKAAADLYNTFGAACKMAGIRYGYHNHSQEFADYEGITPFDVLIERTDPDLVSFELDLFWANVAGIDPVALIKKYPGRIRLLHIKDMIKKMDVPNTDVQVFSNPEMIREIFANQTIVGKGIINFKEIISNIQNDGIEHLIIESDFPQDPNQFAKESIENLRRVI